MTWKDVDIIHIDDVPNAKSKDENTYETTRFANQFSSFLLIYIYY